MTTMSSMTFCSVAMNSGETMRSGVQNTISQVSCSMAAIAACSSSAFRQLLTCTARMPSSSSFSSWSFISEINGETTTVIPLSILAGIW